MKGYEFEFEMSGGVNDDSEFTIVFNATPFVPARTSGDPDDCHDAEGGEIEDLTVFFQEEVKGRSPILYEVPECLWSALGLDRLIEKCQEHAKDAWSSDVPEKGDR
jgi:hypothetical protein